MSAVLKDYLSRSALLRLLAVVLIVLAPHFTHIPAWEICFILAMLGWRAACVLQERPLPGKALLLLCTLAALGGVVASYGRLNGQNAGTALIAAMAALKLLEMRSKRDVMVTVFLLYFLLITHFLFSQEIWTVLYLFACVIGITAFLIETNHPGQSLPFKTTLRMGSRMIGLSVPLMLLLFVLFPRIPGPLWGLPADSGAERSGLPSSMSPGNIAQLILSDELAFRVEFEGEAPPMRDRYWRGPIFDFFDGRTWKTGERYPQDGAPETQLIGEPLRYQITLEPMRTPWLLALDLPSPNKLPFGAWINADHQMVQRDVVRERQLYKAESYARYVLQPQLKAREREANLRLPRFGNDGARTLARNWRVEGLDDAGIIQKALNMYRTESFYYTLRPPKLGEDSVDEFLFETRKGFCEHYASSFVFLMRAAGIPARVVTGYHGGERNAVGNYYLVRQSDAHAWTEVWLDEKGWTRVDPTGAVSPNRIESGVGDALSQAGELPDFLQRSASAWVTIEARWDWVNNQWNQWVLAYGPELQAEFLRKFGIIDWSGMVIALTVLGSLMLGMIGLVLMRPFATPDTRDAALKLWQQLQKRLGRQGHSQRPHEGPRDFVRRIGDDDPALGSALAPALEAYLSARYTGEADAKTLESLRSAMRSLPKR